MKRILFAGLLVAGAGVFVAGQTPSPQAPPTPTFRVDVEYVEVDALVSDKNGQFVRGLTKDDFQVLEDGKPQSITNFSLVDIPIEQPTRPLFASAPIERDVQSNERPFDGRVYVMVLDDYHVDVTRTARVRASARQFIERNLGANDLMAIIFTGGRSQDAQEFTNNKRLLLAAVDHFTGQKLRSATLNRNDDYFRNQSVGSSDPAQDMDEQQRAYNARSMLVTLQKVAEWFGSVRG
ncbi:MAG: VWA domain-containing protein, partial [Acidobacteriaceae bacterium]|nr:VWA domain-containing protein [Acidobacteriaceae bacterium]